MNNEVAVGRDCATFTGADLLAPAGRDRAEGESQMKLAHVIKPWTPEEEECLRSMISERLRPDEIAVKLHRTAQSINKRARKLRLSFKRPGPRP